MNTNLLNIVKKIVVEQGESILDNPRRVSAFFADLAREEPKPQKTAFIKCLEYGFVQVLKNAGEAERANYKQRLAQKLHDEEGLALNLCADSLDLLESVLFGTVQNKKKFCQKCGKELQDNWKTCPFCTTDVGAKPLPSPRPATAPRPAPAPKKPAPAKPASTVPTNKQKADKLFKDGNRLENDGKYHEAIQCYTKAISLNPSYAEAYIHRSESFARLDNFSNAINDAEEAVRLEPVNKDYRKLLDIFQSILLYREGDDLFNKDKFKQAAQYYTKAIRLNPSYSCYAYYARALCYSRLDNLSSAIADAKEAVRLEPKNKDYRKLLDDLLNRDNDDDEEDDDEEDDDEDDDDEDEDWDYDD